MNDYEIGYSDGEDSGGADWYHALTEHTSLSDDADTPMKAVTEINVLEKRCKYLEDVILDAEDTNPYEVMDMIYCEARKIRELRDENSG